MNTEALFLFLILLLGLVLCSFLGGYCGQEGFSGEFSGTISVDQPTNNVSSGASTASPSQYDNYNHYNGSSTKLSSGSTFYGQNGTTAVVATSSDGTQTLQITLPGSNSPVTFTPQQSATDASASTVESYTNFYGANGSATVFYGPNGATATVVTTENGQTAIKVTTTSGTYYYNVSGTPTSTQYYGSTGYTVNEYQGSYGGSAGSVTGPQGNTAYYAQGPGGNTVAGTTTNSNSNSDAVSVNQYYGPYGGNAGTTTSGTGSNDDYYNTLPPGIPRSQIPPGQEDLYI